MITDCKAGKIDLILTKSVSRFARNVVDCISTVRMLSELSSPVGVFFESECIFSLKDDSQMALSFQATMAQEESHTRSRSMETSLRMRLDGGLPLTPKLLGYSHDSEGNLVVNPKEAPTVKLIFYLYLYGYSTSEIAEILTRQGRKTYLGNIKWTSNAVVQVLRNERHCGDVLTRKTFTPNYLTHKAKKNKGDRPQSLYRNHHEAIVSREDYIAAQHLLDNSKYGNKSFLPELRVVDQGLLRGFVVLHPRWAGFQPEDYLQASAAVHKGEEEAEVALSPWEGFELARAQLFSDSQQAFMVFQRNRVRLSSLCVRDLGERNKVELLVDPLRKLLALRTAPSSSRNALTCSTLSNGVYHPREMGAARISPRFLLCWGGISNSSTAYRAFATVGRERQPTFSLEMASLLKEYRSFCQGELELHEGRELTLEDYIFRRHGENLPMTPSTFTWRFKLILKKHGLPLDLNVHSLRHTAASLMISGGADVATVSGLLGHSQVSTTLDIYTHAFDEKKREVSAQMQGRVGV